jgi:hypothetical protein
MSLDNVSMRPQTVYFGTTQVQIQTIKCVADVSSSLNNKYFVFHDSSGAKRYAWFNVGAAGSDPAPAGSWTGHVVAISANASASTVATALTAVLTAVSGFDATSSGATVTLTATATGYAQPARDIDTGFAFKVTQVGATERAVGCLKGDISLTGFAVNKVDVTCHDTGSTVKKQIVSGYENPTLELVLQETDKASLKQVMIDYGMTSFTPVGTDKEEVFGYGPTNVGGDNPKILVRLHPTELDASDKTEDTNFWKCELNLDSFLWSGENVSELPVSMTVFPDTTKPTSIQFFMIGNATLAGY